MRDVVFASYLPGIAVPFDAAVRFNDNPYVFFAESYKCALHLIRVGLFEIGRKRNFIKQFCRRMHNRAAQSGNGCFAVCILLDATLFPPENVILGKVDIFQRDVHRDRFVFGNFDVILDGSVAVFSYLKRVLAYGAFHCVCARRFVEGKIFDFCFAVGADYIDGYAVAACRRIASFGKADGSVKRAVLNYGSRHLDIVSANVAFAVFVFVLVRFYRSRIFDVVLFAILPVICVV